MSIARHLIRLSLFSIKKASKHLRPQTVSDAFDRDFINSFVHQHGNLISGDVLEFNGKILYAPEFVPLSSISTVSHLKHTDRHPDSTFYMDIEDAGTLPEKKFDCIIVTQVLNFCIDPLLALMNLKKMLKPGGHCILTVSGPIYQDYPGSGYKLFFTGDALLSLCTKVFGESNVKDIKTYGDFAHAVYALRNIRKPKRFSSNSTEYSIIVAGVCKNEFL